MYMLGFDLNITWFCLVGILFIGYAILDGFDLGVGILHLLTKKDTDRRVLINSIGPIWDGNEVWLITGGGALFAAFPMVYATVFSGFYLAFILLLMALIFRATAIEFRSKQTQSWWTNIWDTLFCIGSTLAALLIGVALGNMIRGIPLTTDYEYAGTFIGLLNPFSLIIGLFVVSLFAMHGNLYLLLKTEGELKKQIKHWLPYTTSIFIFFYFISTVLIFSLVPRMISNFSNAPTLFIIPLATLFVILFLIWKENKEHYWHAFLASSIIIFLLLLTYGMGTFPYMVYSLGNANNHLSIYNAASSKNTLKTMLIIAAIGVPLVLIYTTLIYRVFKGKVLLDKHSY